MDELDGDMLGIGRAGSIAEGEQPSTLMKALRHRPASSSDALRLGRKEDLWYRGTQFKALSYQCCQVWLCLFRCESVHKATSFNLARMEHVEFVNVALAEELQGFHRFVCLVFVDFAHGETHVNQHPIARLNALWAHQRDTDVAFDAGHINFGDGISVVHDVYNFTWNAETHINLLVLLKCIVFKPL